LYARLRTIYMTISTQLFDVFTAEWIDNHVHNGDTTIMWTTIPRLKSKPNKIATSRGLLGRPGPV